MHDIITLDGEEDESKEVVYLWEVRDGFVETRLDPFFKKAAQACENLALEEAHQFCYMIPELEMGGSLALLESIEDSLQVLAFANRCELQLFATKNFVKKFQVMFKAFNHLRSMVSKSRN